MNHFWSLNWIVKGDLLVSFPAKTETGLDMLGFGKRPLIPADDQLGLGFDAERCVQGDFIALPGVRGG